MNIINKLKCVLTSNMSLDEYFRGLTNEKLVERQKTLKSTSILTALAWISSMTLLLFITELELPLAIAVLISFGGAILASYQDYIRKKEIIEKILKERA